MKFTEKEFRDKVLTQVCEGGFGSIQYIVNMVPIEILMDKYDYGQFDCDDDEEYNEDEHDR